MAPAAGTWQVRCPLGALVLLAAPALRVARGKAEHYTDQLPDVSNDICWVGTWSREVCCRGDETTHPECWDSQYSFGECCPNADCWEGESFTYQKCCDESHGPEGNPACWSGIFSYAHCCLANSTAQSWVDVMTSGVDTEQFYTMDQFYTDSQYGDDFGYYSTGHVLRSGFKTPHKAEAGRDEDTQQFAHFTTYPMALSPHFARVFCRLLFVMWIYLDERAPFRVVEMGAGSGQLSYDVQRCVRGNELGIAPAVWRRWVASFEYLIMERSPALARRQRERGLRVVEGDAQSSSSCVPVLAALADSTACAGAASRGAAECVAGDRGTPESGASVVLSNELLDAFAPVKLRLSLYGEVDVTSCAGWQEIRLVHTIGVQAMREIAGVTGRSDEATSRMLEELHAYTDSTFCGMANSTIGREARAQLPEGTSCLAIVFGLGELLNHVDVGVPAASHNMRLRLRKDGKFVGRLSEIVQALEDQLQDAVVIPRDLYRHLRHQIRTSLEAEAHFLSVTQTRQVPVTITADRCQELGWWFDAHADRVTRLATFYRSLGYPAVHILVRPGEKHFIDLVDCLLGPSGGFKLSIDYGASFEALAHSLSIDPTNDGVFVPPIPQELIQDLPECHTFWPTCAGRIDWTTFVDFTNLAAAGDTLGWRTLFYGPQSQLEHVSRLNLTVGGVSYSVPGYSVMKRAVPSRHVNSWYGRETLASRRETDGWVQRWTSFKAVLHKQCRQLLRCAFDGDSWPDMLVTMHLMEGDAAEGLAEALLAGVRRPLPLGEDAICAALGRLERDPEADPRVAGFLEYLRNATFNRPVKVGKKDVREERPEPQLVEAEPSMEEQPLLQSEQLPLGALGPPPSGEGDEEGGGGAAERSQARLQHEEPRAAGGAEWQPSEGSISPSSSVPAKRKLMAATAKLSIERRRRSMEVDVATAAATIKLEVSGINVSSLDLLSLKEETVHNVRASWADFVDSAGSKQAAGEIIYNRLFQGQPQLQKFFVTPRTVQGLRFASALEGLVAAAGDPIELKGYVEALAFAHLQQETSVERVEVFRDTLINAIDSELQDRFLVEARAGWMSLFNYAGGALVYTRSLHAERIRALHYSWNLANDVDGEDRSGRAGRPADAKGGSGESFSSGGSTGKEQKEDIGVAQENRADGKDARANTEGRWLNSFGRKLHVARRKNSSNSDSAYDSGEDQPSGKTDKGRGSSVMNTSVPKTYAEMFEWNVVVMGFGGSTWLRQILMSFDTIVMNVDKMQRLQEECEIVALRITKIANGQVNLGQYRSCMLAALRSRLPKIWDQKYEIAWGWLWDNVERILKQTIGKPLEWERALAGHMSFVDSEEGRAADNRNQIYDRFFELAPQGQDYFKQSNTRLHFIAQRIQEMTLEIYKDPWKLVEEISALGLRHVGYGIPTELIPPYVTASVEVQSRMNTDPVALESYKWALNLIAKVLTRTIREGSTLVMKAINSNSAKMLKKAVAEAPRGKRAEWVLNVQVGTHRISPLSWALQSGKLEAARAVIEDLLTIRADREQYYYGLDHLFSRHPDIVTRLCNDAPALLHTMFEGLVWRSRHTKNGMRRVNFYVKHLVIQQDGSFSDALRALAQSKDQEIISHPVIVLVSDTLWTGVVRRQFVLARLGFLLNLFVFMLSQAILPKSNDDAVLIRYSILAGRVVNYTFSVMRLGRNHARDCYRAFSEGKVRRVLRVPVPSYLFAPQAALSLTLLAMLVCMLTQEPMIWCLGDRDVSWPTEECPAANDRVGLYSVFSMTAMVILWVMLKDMAVFSTKLLAFVLVIRHVLSEVGRFVATLMFILLTFASALSCLRQSKSMEFADMPRSANCLFSITVGLYEGDYRELAHEPFLLAGVLLFVSVSTILLINLLIAQLNCSYEYVYQDMVGFARLARATLICETVTSCPPARWERFVETLKLDKRLEFDEGDEGLSGGIQVRESGSLHPMNADMIKRFGGSFSADMPWPKGGAVDEEEKLERVEQLMHDALRCVNASERSAFKTGRWQKRRQEASGSSRSSGSFGSAHSSSRSGQ